MLCGKQRVLRGEATRAMARETGPPREREEWVGSGTARGWWMMSNSRGKGGEGDVLLHAGRSHTDYRIKGLVLLLLMRTWGLGVGWGGGGCSSWG